MPEPAIDPAEPASIAPAASGKRAARSGGAGIGVAIRKRWRAWLRAIHRDIGYLAVGFTVIYALSGIAMNHIEDWDPNFHATEIVLKIPPIPAELSDAEATRRIASVAGTTGAIDDVYRAGDEVRLSYQDGTKLTAIGGTLTVQRRRDRFFFRVADWLHATRGKQAWKFVADLYAALLLYLAVSGIFMIKGRLGLRWRGAALIGLGLALPLGYIVLSGGPGAQRTERVATRPGEVDPPPASAPAGPGARPATRPAAGEIKPLPPDDDEKPAAGMIKPLPPDDDEKR
ncbi:MAG TPA: PepSY-associated TM helix domain-containing protein [Kofleriaceae bacterium]|jgi:hypothetical protein|nr:PepSY-associated TM helix domain-containing protein [Kofleriaceae bacterium]